jgi:hypothetical protein
MRAGVGLVIEENRPYAADVLVVVVDVAGVVYRFAYPSLSAHRVRVTGSWKLYRFPGSDCPQCLSKSTGCCFRAQ